MKILFSTSCPLACTPSWHFVFVGFALLPVSGGIAPQPCAGAWGAELVRTARCAPPGHPESLAETVPCGGAVPGNASGYLAGPGDTGEQMPGSTNTTPVPPPCPGHPRNNSCPPTFSPSRWQGCAVPPGTATPRSKRAPWL